MESRPRFYQATWFRVVAAVAAMFTAILLQYEYWEYLQPFAGVLTYPALLVSVLIGGFWGGIASTVVGAPVIVYVFLPPMFSWRLADPHNILAVIVFLLLGFTMSWMSRSLQIARHRLAEETRLSAEDRFRRLFEQAPIGIFVSDPQGVYEDVNDAGAEMMGRTHEQVVGSTIADLLDPAEIERLARHIPDVHESKSSHGDWQFRRLDGSVFTGEVFVHELSDGRLQALVRDVSELRQEQDELEAALQSTVDVLARVCEARDPYTAGHQERVADIAVAIAQELGMSEADVADIRLAGLIHDVGKIAIPAEILTKPGKLNDNEFLLVRQHAQSGYDILADARMPGHVVELVHQHHERCDGSGYPRQLTADEMLPGAKVLGVADVVEAMASHRPYRRSQGLDAALAEIRRGRGSAYDPDVCDACEVVLARGDIEFWEAAEVTAHAPASERDSALLGGGSADTARA